MFVDSVTVELWAGTGGSGAEAFRREKGVPRGGPCGGDGGKGGDIVLVVDEGLTTLSDYRYRRHHRAERGRHGEGANRTGRSGNELQLRVPPGTIAIDDADGTVLGELMRSRDKLIVAQGGRGGRGNARFRSATHQAPHHWEPGREGEHRVVRLELKLIADVGLVGEPNAGKSTLLSRISQARPKIADYPFTTLTPALGVVELPGYRSFVVADIPGIIEGAHEGRGLGHQFLRHIERTRLLALLVPVDVPDPEATLTALRSELASYSAELAARPFAVLFSKTDLGSPNEAARRAARASGAWGSFALSAVSGEGVDALLESCWEQLRSSREAEATGAASERKKDEW